MYTGYLLAPAVGWFVAGTVKFAVNTVRVGKPAWGRIGYGGLPSTHTSIVSTVAWLIGLRDGFGDPAFGAAAALVTVVVLDAISLRRYVGLHAAALNAITSPSTHLRERVGHAPHEVAAGVVVGFCCAFGIWKVA